MTWRSVLQGMCVVAAAWALAPVEARAGERDAVADAVSRTMEAANTRMKAAMEEARLLEAAGRRDEALAVLRTVPALYDEALRAVRSLVGGPDATPRTAVGVEPRRTPPVARSVAARTRPVVDPVPGAVAYLLRCQDGHGFFDPRRGAAPDDPAIPSGAAEALLEDSTGVALLALLDVAGARVDPRTDVGAAILRGADALLARASAPGAFLPTSAAWALATTLSRTGDARYRPAVRAGAEAALTELGPTLGRDFVASLPDLVEVAALLHEVLALSLDDALNDRIRAALAAFADGLRERPRESVPVPAARLARDLLVRAADGPAVGRPAARPDSWFFADARPGVRLDGFEVLFGTVYAKAAYGFDDEAEGRAWWDGVLVPTVNAQGRDGPAAGSWSPPPAGAAGPGVTRLRTTAQVLLAWLAPSTPYFDAVPLRGAAPSDDDGDEDDGR
ncbi:MAG: hypothetical protein U1E39_02495 [Planctomycetota bacterium]